jgi:hypothetical protein
MELNQSPAEVLEQPQTAEAPVENQVTDLDGLSEFSFQGSKYTPDQLLQIVNGYKQASEQQTSYAQEQKFYENLEADIENVLKDPAKLAQQFKEIYPKKFHGILEKVLKANGQTPALPTPASNALPPDVLEKLRTMEERLKFHDQRTHQAEVQNATAQIDKITGPLFKKFPMSDEEAVFAKAENLLTGGTKLTEKTWERLVRESHEKAEKRWNQHQDATLKQQMDKGRRAADMGPGGATPGQAPQKPRTLDEARDALLRQVQQQS